MKSKLIFILLFSILSGSIFSQPVIRPEKKNNIILPALNPAKPGVLWWWFAGKIKEEDVRYQIDWLKENNIGSVLIFFLYPLNKIKKDTINYAPRYEFLGKDFSNITASTKKYCDSLGISCNFLFGTGWPFGGSFVTKDEATLTWTNKGTEPMRTFSVSWEWPKKGYVIDHLNKNAVDNYFNRVNAALLPAIQGNKSLLECDSWEIAEFEPIWTPGFDKMFSDKYGYDITPYVSKHTETDKKDAALYKIIPYTSQLFDRNDKSLYDVRYDYYKLVSDLALNNFYRHYTERCNSIGAGSVVECCGTPADIIDAFAAVDVPMSEAMLYEPNYSKIPASAATLAGKNIVTAETFTCAYGWKDKYAYKEQIADMKLIADAMFANGVNHIYWHGYALNPKGFDTVCYYATVNVSIKSKLIKGFKEFNEYMENVSSFMQKGKTHSEIAVYLPMEDRWAEGIYEQDFLNQLQPEERFWHFSKYQMRYEKFPAELEGYPMLWINSSFIAKANYKNKTLSVGATDFKVLYIDVKYLPYQTLLNILNLAQKGLRVCLKQEPAEPGKNKHNDYTLKLQALKALKNVSASFSEVYNAEPMLRGDQLPEYWIRKDGNEIYIFLANPKTKNLKYPITYGQSLQTEIIERKITLNYNNKQESINLSFKPYQSLIIKIDKKGKYNLIEISFIPPTPQTKF
ncbi:MAG: hypothetical protein KA792_05045 [Bacteroidales bacterium]|nr:hypothetical protein [Bacteroidales bacterium]